MPPAPGAVVLDELGVLLAMKVISRPNARRGRREIETWLTYGVGYREVPTCSTIWQSSCNNICDWIYADLASNICRSTKGRDRGMFKSKYSKHQHMRIDPSRCESSSALPPLSPLAAPYSTWLHVSHWRCSGPLDASHPACLGKAL